MNEETIEHIKETYLKYGRKIAEPMLIREIPIGRDKLRSVIADLRKQGWTYVKSNFWKEDEVNTLINCINKSDDFESGIKEASKLLNRPTNRCKDKYRKLNLNHNIQLLEGEEFRKIKGYDKYEISNMGRVRAQYYYGYRILKCHKAKDGYISATLSINRNVSKQRVHRLVAETFLENPNDYPEVDHIDGNRTNNKLSNLRWVSGEENLNNPIRLARLKKIASKSGFTAIKYSKTTGEILGVFNSLQSLYKNLGLEYINPNKKIIERDDFIIEMSNRNIVEYSIGRLLHNGYSKEEIIEEVSKYNEDDIIDRIYEELNIKDPK